MAAPRPWWQWGIAGGIGAMVLTGVTLTGWRVCRPRPIAVEDRHTLSDHLTPFRAVATLRRIEADPLVRLSDAQRAELWAEIQSAESDLFARRETNGEAERIRQSADRWIEMARRHYVPSGR